MTLLRAFAVLTALATTFPVSAQQPRTFGGSIEVNVVNLFVTVVDRNGDPVPGLGADEFVIREDGTVREITNFLEVDPRGTASTTAGMPRGATLPPARGLSSGNQPSVVFLFDLSSLESQSMKRIVQELRPRLGDGASREYLVATLLNGDLEIVQAFTSDRERVTTALDTVAGRTPQGSSLKQRKFSLERDIRQARVVQGSVGGSSPGNTVVSGDGAFTVHQANQFLAQVNALQRQETVRIGNSLSAMQGLLRVLAGRPERKVLVWIGQDHALRPAVDVYTTLYDRFSSVSSTLMLDPPELWATEGPLLEQHRRVATDAQRSGVSVYALDPTDRDRELASADIGGSDVLSTATAAPSVDASRYDLTRAWDLNDGASLVASATGGRLYANSRNLGVFFDDLENQIDHYYSLGYGREATDEDELRSIQVSVTRDGCRVRHHAKVRDASPVQRLVDFTASALHLGSSANPLALQIEVGATLPSVVGDSANLPVTVALPSNVLTMVPSDDGSWVGQIAVAAMALDDDDRTSEPFVRRMRLRLPAEQVAAGALAGTQLMTQIDDDAIRLAVAVLDELSGTMAAVGSEIPIRPE